MDLRDNEIRSRFVDSGKGYSTTGTQYPEDAVAYNQEYILTLYEKGVSCWNSKLYIVTFRTW